MTGCPGSPDSTCPGPASEHPAPVLPRTILTHPVCLALLLDRQLPSQLMFLDSSSLVPHLITGQPCSRSPESHNTRMPTADTAAQLFLPVGPAGHHPPQPSSMHQCLRLHRTHAVQRALRAFSKLSGSPACQAPEMFLAPQHRSGLVMCALSKSIFFVFFKINKPMPKLKGKQ